MQYEYHPDNYEDDGSLKPGAAPLITQEMVEDGLNHRSIKRWAYIWHDKDVIIDEGEAGSDTLKTKDSRYNSDVIAKTNSVIFGLDAIRRKFNALKDEVAAAGIDVSVFFEELASLKKLGCIQDDDGIMVLSRGAVDRFIDEILPNVDSTKKDFYELGRLSGKTDDEINALECDSCVWLPSEDRYSTYIVDKVFQACGDLQAEVSAMTKYKPKHIHIVLNCPSQIELSSVANWFGIPENYIDVPKGRGAFLDCVEYLTHESAKEQAKGKYRYSDSEVVANFDFRAELTVRAQRQEKYGRDAANRMTASDEMKLHVMQDGWTMRECREKDPLTYIKVRDALPKLRLDYLLDQPPCPFRMNIYVDGLGGLGKGALCEYIAQKLFPDVEKPFFVVGNDARVAFDGYDGEQVIIWDDYRAAQFIKNFGRGATFNIFDTHPRQQAQQAKHSRVVLTNAVNIVNSVEPYMQFMDGLAGQYQDRDGIQHQAEDKNQSYRRFPLIMCVRENDFDILFNRGFVDKDSYAYQQYDRYERVRGSMKQVQTRLSGVAKERVLVDMTKPALDCYHMLVSNHDDKISDPDQIPDEFKPYGTTYAPEDFAEEEEMRKIDNLFSFVDEYVRVVEPLSESDVLRCCRSAIDYTDKFAHHVFKDMPWDKKQQILEDAASFGEKQLSAFVMREYSKSYYDDIPADIPTPVSNNTAEKSDSGLQQKSVDDEDKVSQVSPQALADRQY